MLEVRRSKSNAPINLAGRIQGQVVAIEATVKDMAGFPESGRGIYFFDAEIGLKDPVKAFPRNASVTSAIMRMGQSTIRSCSSTQRCSRPLAGTKCFAPGR